MDISGTGGGGSSGNYLIYNLTTSGTPSTEGNQDLGQLVFETLIINDGTAIIQFGFDNATTVSNKVFSLGAGESLSIKTVYQTLYFKSVSASQSFRVLVLW